MKAFSTDILVSKHGGKQILVNAAWQAKILLAKNILHRIAGGASAPLDHFVPGEEVQLEEALALIELR